MNEITRCLIDSISHLNNSERKREIMEFSQKNINGIINIKLIGISLKYNI